MRDVDALVELRDVTQEIIERFTEAFPGSSDYPVFIRARTAISRVAALLDSLESERSRVDRLEKALEPFAKIAEAEDHAGTKPGESVLVNVDRCRDARAALGKEDVSD
jgi:hypothetical protein